MEKMENYSRVFPFSPYRKSLHFMPFYAIEKLKNLEFQENLFKFSIPISKSPSHLRYTILGSRFPLCNAISEGRPPLCNTSSEAGRQPFNVRIENLRQKFQKFSWKSLSSTVHVTLIIMSRKYFFWFFEIYKFSCFLSHPRYTILESRFPLCNAISEGRPPLCNMSSEAVRQPFNVRIETKILKVFLETTFLHSSCHPDHYGPKIFFLVFRNL